LPEVKHIMISVPDNLLREVDGLAREESKDRSEFVREAMKMYINERKRFRRREKMKVGYKVSGEINIEWVECCFEAENQACKLYLKSLMESE